MKKLSLLGAALMAMFALTAGTAHADVIIDTFDDDPHPPYHHVVVDGTTPGEVAVPSPSPNTARKKGMLFSNPGTIVGDERDMFVFRYNGSSAGAFVQADVDKSVNKAFSFSTGNNGKGYATLVWDGVDTGPGSDTDKADPVTGLKFGLNVDLMPTNEQGIRLIYSNQVAATITLTLYNSATKYSEAVIPLALDDDDGVTDLTYKLVKWDEFTKHNGGVNLHGVNAISLKYDGGTLHRQDGFVVSDIRSAHVPEPGSMALLLGGAAPMLLKLRRRKKEREEA